MQNDLSLDSFSLKNYRDFKEIDLIKIDERYFLNANNGYSHCIYFLNTKTKLCDETKIANKKPYLGAIANVYDEKYYMLSSYQKIKIYELDKEMIVVDSLIETSYSKIVSKSIFGNIAYCLITKDTSNTISLEQLNIKNKSVAKIKLENKNNYHQVYQLNDSITCLVSSRDSNLIISSFKNDNANNKVDYIIPFSLPYRIFKIGKNNELFLKYKSNESSTSLVKTKGFASIIDSLSSAKPLDDKDKTFIVANENNFGNIQQSADYSSARVLFKDSLDLSNSFVKIYTETGDEILTYSLSKDQKELPIQTDKLYHGTYFVRLNKNGEEHNLGKLIIVR